MKVAPGLRVPRDARVRACAGPQRGDGLFAGLVFPQTSRLSVKDKATAGTGKAASEPLQKTGQSPGSSSTNGASPGHDAIGLSETLLVAEGS
jgi:hypothetical protein